MPIQALHTAATGMAAQEINVNVISNNIANMRTTGYKRQRAEFQDLLYQNLRRVGATTSNAGTFLPSGVQIGTGVKTAAVARIMTQGSLVPTDKDTDIALRGEGFLTVSLPDGRTGYTRDGALELSPTGQFVTSSGYVIGPGITVPAGASQVSINSEGRVEVIENNQVQPTQIGQLQLARFTNKAGLEAIGDNIYVQTNSSGDPILGVALGQGFGNIVQRHLENANVNPVTEISSLITAQRAYEMNSRVIRAADEMMSETSNIR